MDRAWGWRWWLRRLIFGRRTWVPLVLRFYPPNTPWWKRWWYRFRPPPAPAARPFPRPPWVMPPEDELGVAVDVRKVLATGPAVAVAVTDCVAYSTGFQLGIAIRRKEELVPPPRPPLRPPEPIEFSLELGVRFSDGRETSRTRTGRGMSEEMRAYFKAWSEGQDPPPPAGPVIGPMGGGGGGRRWDMHYWIWPLPPDGPLTVTCTWEAGGVTASSVELDGGAIRRAGEGSEKLWGDGHS